MPVEVGSLLALGRKDEALKLAAQAENSPAVDLALAEVFLSGKLPDQALNSLKKAAASGRRPPSRFYFIKAKALDATGNPSAALKNFQKAVGLEPNSEEYLLATAELYSRQNKHTESFELLQRAHAIDPNSLAVLRPFILEAVFAKKAEEALDAAQLLESESEKPEDLYVVASVLLQNKRDDEAVPLLEKYLSQVPGDTRAWVGLGIAYENNKRFADSQKAFERAIQTDPKNAQAEYQLGALVSDQGNSAPAIEHLERALQLNPNHGPALAKLGNLYLQAGQFEKARDSLRKAESLQPNNPETEYGLALAYGKLGDREEAKIHMDRFQQLRPGAPKKN
jgi:tetratricopeptide (TPR) repeat protein